jgi:hypothetical protein
MWAELKQTQAKAHLIGFIYRNPSSTMAWFDNFVCMMDKVLANNSNILLLGDFNLDLLKTQTMWESTYTMFGLTQMIKNPTRITSTSSTLIDHIYTNNINLISNAHLSGIHLSDHSPIICSWTSKIPAPPSKGHTAILYRSMKRFDQLLFLRDLSTASFSPVYQCDNADDALAKWYDTYIPVLDKHAPLRRKRVKHPTIPRWLTPDIIQAMKVRDTLKKNKQFDEYKKQRNCVKGMVREAKKNYFNTLVSNNSNITSIWQAVNELTHKSRCTSLHSNIQASADELNNHFTSLAPKLLEDVHKAQDSDFTNLSKLEQFSKSKLSPESSATIPKISVHEVGAMISKLREKKNPWVRIISALTF